MLIKKFFLNYFLLRKGDDSFLEILQYFNITQYTVMIPAAPQETVGEAMIEPGTAKKNNFV
jgi:hypothetical protein